MSSGTIAAWLGGQRHLNVCPGDGVETVRTLLRGCRRACASRRAARTTSSATLAAVDRGGACTALGHAGGFDAFGAALVNGTAAHGEDFDDTFEGGPVHSGAVIVPAVLAVCEREGLGGDAPARSVSSRASSCCAASVSWRRWQRTRPASIRRPSSGAVAAAGAVGCGAAVAAGRDCVGAGHRREHGVRHHRVPRRGHVDQAHARRMGGAVRHPRGADGARRIPGAAHRVRRRTRVLSRVRSFGDARLRSARRAISASAG